MPRPRKCRRVCCMPQVSVFGPEGGTDAADPLLMTVEEYEVIRLIDWNGLSQEEAAAEMGVARSTVQRIYGEARHKLADCIVNGRTLKIGGGNYRLCSNGELCGCRRRCCPSCPDCGTETESKG
ncbi:DUF134 domain-containing protein [Caproiciproducens sp. NJN-50]|uniref:DUF134 domain-containing protein n=1 Tax=Acutalibacteraceae TaxID=3082771 RepID=UPI000FFE235D|nr:MULTISPECIES: DUF134 domain-containing protein [Acutalibacteraceae]QAT50495.1 DUF134 domain-containing protein [Caproiciproducens sp. NJN-50]